MNNEDLESLEKEGLIVQLTTQQHKVWKLEVQFKNIKMVLRKVLTDLEEDYHPKSTTVLELKNMINKLEEIT